MQLHKRDVVTKAAAILDAYGLADLTMRRLARELDVTPGALYWHFASKQELLGGVADLVLEGVVLEWADHAPADWRSRITDVCRHLREALLTHTDGAELVSASFAAGQSEAMARILGALCEAATDVGMEANQAALAARSIVYYVLGFTVDEQSRLQWDAAGAQVREPSAGGDPSARFAFGLRLLINGIGVETHTSAEKFECASR